MANLDSKIDFIKYSLVVVSTICKLTGICLIGLGTYDLAAYSDFRQLYLVIDGHFSTPSVLLIASGLFIIAVATLGFYGAYKESVMLINLYGVCLFLVLILEVSIVITTFVSYSAETTIETMNGAFKSYSTDRNVANQINDMQSRLSCCGVHNTTNWMEHLGDNTTYTFDQGAIRVPNSCCNSEESKHARNSTHFVCKTAFEQGCFHKINDKVWTTSIRIAIGLSIVAFFQVLGMICAFYLAKLLRWSKSLLAVSRWNLFNEFNTNE
ncbi:CD63 antigen-like [Drosophila takahashii]|uniref:CD63 antigen-like n=1 Tax=Drosophila takahashii TaxID=29030 RepID=UPI001CF82F1E|nr:CD63 antigen-like [Drosophila takahashii]